MRPIPSKPMSYRISRAKVSLAAARALLLTLLVRHLCLHAFISIRVGGFVTTILILVPELARFAQNSDLAAKIFARRFRVMFTLLMAYVAFAFILFAEHQRQNAQVPTEIVVSFFIAGMVLGLLVRFLFIKFLEDALSGGSTDRVELLIYLVM